MPKPYMILLSHRHFVMEQQQESDLTHTSTVLLLSHFTEVSVIFRGVPTTHAHDTTSVPLQQLIPWISKAIKTFTFGCNTDLDSYFTDVLSLSAFS